MPYKDPEKRRQMNRLYGATYRTTTKGKAAGVRSSLRWADSHPEERRASSRERQRRYRQRHPARQSGTPEQHLARSAVAHAIAAGRLVRRPCVVCGASRAQAHHAHGYDRAHWLDVEWLCAIDHRARHPIPRTVIR